MALDMEVVPDLVCGRTNRDERSEALTRMLRVNQGFKTDGGCGRSMTYLWAYRCGECGRWLHRGCLYGHFIESKHDEATPPPLAAATAHQEENDVIE